MTIYEGVIDNKLKAMGLGKKGLRIKGGLP